MDIVDLAKQEIIKRSNEFERITKCTKDEYNLYREHVQYVYKYALKISENLDVDKEVVQLAALLHDISMTDPNLDRSIHNELGANIAYDFLKNNNYPEEKCELIKKCILNHSSKRKEFRTTKEENVLVNADALAHFDCVLSLYSLAHNVMGLNEEESVKFVYDKLTKDYNEIDDDVKPLIQDIYEKVSSSTTYNDLLKI